MACTQASADVYRCTGEDGSVTFSQTPCSKAAERVSVDSGAPATATSKDCKHAGHFSDAVARLMQVGMEKSDVLDEFGGAEKFSRDSMRLVNYVYQFKSTKSITPERIATLTSTQCETGTLGDVSCAALPEKYTRAGGGCSKSFSPNSAAPQAFDFSAQNKVRAKKDREKHEFIAEQGRKMAEQREHERKVSECRAEFQSRIDHIQGQMRMGSDPSRHRVELQRLERKMSECR